MQDPTSRKRKRDTFFSESKDPNKEDVLLPKIMKKFIKMCLFVSKDLEEVATTDTYAAYLHSLQEIDCSENEYKKQLFTEKLDSIFEKLHITDDQITTALIEAIPDMYFKALETRRSEDISNQDQFKTALTAFSKEVLESLHHTPKKPGR
ncbi:MAG: hypothetical protein NXI01_06235 [Gammaproteobacteria bacterium]|nr:hypothetical protein [Gammaproteobacteria bacterium]